MTRFEHRFLSIAVAAAISVQIVSADTLPLRRVGLQQGLLHPRVERIVRDSRGLLWLCTSNALSVHDGVAFRHFRADWIPGEHEFHDVAEAPDGTMWVGIWRGGVAFLDPSAPRTGPGLVPVSGGGPLGVRRLLFDEAGRLWIAALEGLFRIDHPDRRDLAEIVPVAGAAEALWDIEFDDQGRPWVASAGNGAWILAADGTRTPLALVADSDPPRALTILRGRDGTMWVGHDLGLARFTGDGSLIARYSYADLGDDVVVDVFEARGGDLWIAGSRRVLRFDGNAFEPIDLPANLDSPRRFAEDDGGRLWMGTMTGGALTWSVGGVVALLERDGLEFSRMAWLHEDRDGRVLATAGSALYAYRDRRFRPIRPAALEGLDSGRMTDNGVVLHDAGRRWWIGSRRGLFAHGRGPVESLASATPTPVAGIEPEIDGRVTALFESPEGAIWVGTANGAVFDVDAVATAARRRYTVGGPALGGVRAFARSKTGRLWVVGADALAWVDTDNAKMRTVPEMNGRRPMDLLFDPEGRLLVATGAAGVWISDDPELDRPSFRPLPDTAELQGARCLARDPAGRIYVGTKNGLVRLGDSANPSRLFTTSDGLTNVEIWRALSDQHGRMWFSSERGITRIDPDIADRAAAPATPVWVDDIRIGGQSLPIPQLGVRVVEDVVVPPGRSAVEIDVVALSFDPGRPTRFQYRLESPGARWSPPSTDRTVTLVGLGPGRYSLAIRSVSGDAVSPLLARVEFRVTAPFWRRSWFVALVGLGFVIAGVAIARARLRRTRELNEIRFRIATDLHDDIGSGLSQVSVLSEIVRRRIGRVDDDVGVPLHRIGEVARELVDAMGEIVWAISPKRDSLKDLAQHMRRFASDALEPERTRLLFEARGCDSDRSVGPRIRRDLYLILKEAIHNVVKHADATVVRVSLRRERRALVLEIDDDGRGFDPSEPSTGLGRPSGASRAAGLDGEFQIDSEVGRGTRVRVRIPYPTGWWKRSRHAGQ